jgi:hypothetical protein
VAARSTRARNGRIWTGMSGWKAGRELWRACSCVIERNSMIYLLEITYSCRVVVHDDDEVGGESRTWVGLTDVTGVGQTRVINRYQPCNRRATTQLNPLPPSPPCLQHKSSSNTPSSSRPRTRPRSTSTSSTRRLVFSMVYREAQL